MAALAACHSWHATPPATLTPEQLNGPLRITTTGGQTITLHQATTRGDTLVGRDVTGREARQGTDGRPLRQAVFRTVRLPFADIDQLEIRAFDSEKTVGRSVIIGLPVTAALIMVLVFFTGR